MPRKPLEQQIEEAQAEIQQHKNRMKRLQQQHKEEQRKVRTKRLIAHGALLEHVLEGAAESLSNEQVETLLRHTLTSDTAKRMIHAMRAQNALAQNDAENPIPDQLVGEGTVAGSSMPDTLSDTRTIANEPVPTAGYRLPAEAESAAA